MLEYKPYNRTYYQCCGYGKESPFDQHCGINCNNESFIYHLDVSLWRSFILTGYIIIKSAVITWQLRVTLWQDAEKLALLEKAINAHRGYTHTVGVL